MLSDKLELYDGISMKPIWGKVVGATLGLALGGGPLGVLLGVVAGHAYDLRNEPGNPWSAMGATAQGFAGTVEQASFTMGVVVLGAKMAKADGRVTRAEIEAFKRVFQVEASQEERIGALFDRARRSAEMTPMLTPPTSHSTDAPMASEIVTGSALVICGQTGCWLRNE